MKRSKNRNLSFKKLVTYLGLNNELTAQERLDEFIKEQRHQTLLDRIKAIRTNSYFIPDYDKPKAYTDINIYDIDGNVISGETKLVCDRPIDFNGDIKAWKKIVRLDHIKELKEKKLKQLQEEQRKLLFDTEINPRIMKSMMEVY